MDMDRFLEACGTAGRLHWSVERTGTARADLRSFDRPYVVVGRDPRCDLLLDDRAVSPRHAYLQVVGGNLFCVDLGSRLGTYLGGRCQRTGWIGPRQAVRIGPYRVRLNTGDAPEPEHADRPEEAEAPVLAALPEPRLTLDLSHRAVRPATCTIANELSLIGSAADCQVRLLDPSVANYHCSLLNTPLGVWVVDLLGEGGVAVNGVAQRCARIDDGDELRVGHSTIRVWRGASRVRVPLARPVPDHGTRAEPVAPRPAAVEVQVLKPAEAPKVERLSVGVPLALPVPDHGPLALPVPDHGSLALPVPDHGPLALPVPDHAAPTRLSAGEPRVGVPLAPPVPDHGTLAEPVAPQPTKANGVLVARRDPGMMIEPAPLPAPPTIDEIAIAVVESTEVRETLDTRDPARAEVLESLMVPLVEHFSRMQQQMFDQFHEARVAMFQMFVDLQQDQAVNVQQELDQLRQVSRELDALRSSLAMSANGPSSRPRPNGAPPAITRLGAAVPLSVIRPDDASSAPSRAAFFPNGNGHANRNGNGHGKAADRWESASSPGDPPASAGPSFLGRDAERPPHEDIHALLCERIAAIQREHKSRWQKLLSMVPAPLQGKASL